MSNQEDEAFDHIMKIVGNDGKFQKVFNYFYNVALVCFASMAYMNIVLVLNEPDHTCHVPGRDQYDLTVAEWNNLTLPMETDNRGSESISGCKMYNITNQLGKPIDQWVFPNASDAISCAYGYDYDKTWYKRTAVSDEDWICERGLFLTNTFVFHRVGELLGTFIFGQLGDTIGRRPVFYISTIIIIIGRILTVLTTSTYVLFAIASLLSMLTSMSIFISPLIIAMETSKEEDRAHIAMMQCIGWTMGISIMPLVFWVSGDWVWFLMATTLPIGLFALYPKYMIESPRWLATKRYLKRCAIELNRIGRINKSKVEITEKMLQDILPQTKAEEVYGIASLFTGWRLARNTLMVVTCWSSVSIIYFVVILNSTRLGGNPFLGFLYQSAVELPSFILGRWLGDRIGRRLTNALSFFLMTAGSLLLLSFVRYPEYEDFTLFVFIFIKMASSITWFAVNLQAMEIYPTCLRQSGISVGSIAGNAVGIFGPYIVYLGTEYDVRYPYLILSIVGFFGLVSALMLPETLHAKLPNTLEEAKNFGRDQLFFSYPKKPKTVEDDELQALRVKNEHGNGIKN